MSDWLYRNFHFVGGATRALSYEKNMPVYLLQCNKCKKTKKALLKVEERRTQKCECGGDLHTMLAPSTFILKGNGWEKDGYQ